MLARTLIAAGALMLAGCATRDDFTSLSKEFLKDEKGHVVGEREKMRNERTGETVERIEVFVVLEGPQGALIGYEQRVPGGSIVRDAEGNPIGARYIDLRSRGSNPHGSGLLLLLP